MVARQRRVPHSRVAEPSLNWGLLLLVVLCLEFWLIVMRYIAQAL